MKKILIFVLAFFIISLSAEEYELGHGYRVNDTLNVGGYFSLDYAQGKSVDKVRLDDLAFLVYGDLSSNFSYFIELEAAPFYVKDFKNSISETNTDFYWERAYANYVYSEMFNFRIGKFITPIGYWNLEPINVLRDTSSNPLYSYKMFPKFVTGVDVNGYIDLENTLKYHLFGQVTDDIDTNYINIKNDLFIGIALAYEPDYETSIGTSFAYFEAKDTLTTSRVDNKNILLLQANAKYDNFPYLIQAEIAYTDIDNKILNVNDYQLGGYVQGVYNFSMEHAIVSRYEYFEDTQSATKLKDNIAIVGYSYRPMYSVSLKGEYQFHSITEENKFLVSFSVLF